MNKPITIAVDAMGGDNSPEKVIKGIALHSSKSEDVFYKIFGDENLLNPLINKLLKKKIIKFFILIKKSLMKILLLRLLKEANKQVCG